MKLCLYAPLVQMPYEVSIALRYMRARRKAGISMTTQLTTLGVALGVAALTVVTSVWNGFEAEFLEKLLGINAHSVIIRNHDVFRDHEEVSEALHQKPGVRHVAPFVYSEVIVQTDKSAEGVAIKGIDPEKAQHTPLAKYMNGVTLDVLTDTASAANRLTLPGILLGTDLQERLHAEVGQPVSVISPYGGQGGEARTRNFRVAGIFHSGVHEFDSRMVFINLSESQRFFGLYGTVTGLEVWTTDPMTSLTTVNRAARQITPHDPLAYEVRDWSDTNRALFGAVRDQKKWISIMLFIIVVVASFNIMATLILLVIEKTREIAVLKSIGANNRSILSIFVLDGQIVGFVGCTLGLLLGLTTCAVLQKYGLKLDPRVYYLEHLPMVVKPIELAAITAGAMFFATLATFFPAFAAAQSAPVDGLTDRTGLELSGT